MKNKPKKIKKGFQILMYAHHGLCKKKLGYAIKMQKKINILSSKAIVHRNE